MKAPTSKSNQKTYTISKTSASSGNTNSEELLVIESKWRSYARIQKIPKATCLMCIVFDEAKVNRMIEVLKSEGENLPKLPAKFYHDAALIESASDFIEPIYDYLCSLARVPRLFGVLGPCKDSQYTRIVAGLGLLQEMPFFQSLLKASNVKEVACIGEIKENYQFPIITHIVPLLPPYHPSSLPFFHVPDLTTTNDIEEENPQKST